MQSIRPSLVSCFALFLCVCQSAGAAETGDLLPLWRVAGANNHVYLLGSIHALRKSDYPLPTAMYDAYEDSDALYMELDMDDIDPIATQALINELGLIQDEKTLADIMGPRLYSQASDYAAAIDIPLAMLGKAEPWYAAITVDNLLLARLGFNAMLGIEMHFVNKAQSDGKPVFGLETERQQLSILDELSMRVQKKMLLQSLLDGADIDVVLESMLEAWRVGDTERLEKELLGELRSYPELLNALVKKRNLAWIAELEKMLKSDRNYLVAVGALHLVGDIGLPALLESRDYSVEQLRRSR